MRIPLSELEAPAHLLRENEAIKVEELASSMRAQGQLQAILVRQTPKGYQVIDGRRRQLAAMSLGWSEIEASVIEATDAETIIKALVANVQREGLSPIEQGQTLRLIMLETGWGNREIERRGIMSAGRVTHLLQLLGDPPEVLEFLDKGLSEGHLRATRRKGLHKRDRLVLLRAAVREGQSVREAEKAAFTRVNGKIERKRATEKPSEPPREAEAAVAPEKEVTPSTPPLSEARILLKIGPLGLVWW